MDVIHSALFQTLLTFSLAVVALLGAYATNCIVKASAKLKEQTAQISDEHQRQLVENALADVERLAGVTVNAMEQTTAAALRESVKDGKVDRAELLALGKIAFRDIKAKICPEAQAAITQNLGSFDEYLKNLIESKVLEVKTSPGIGIIGGDAIMYETAVAAGDESGNSQ